MTRRSTVLVALPILALACDVPISPITEGDSYRTPPPATYISGTIEVLDGITSAPGGPTILFRFDCDNPPPPAGTGRPVDMVVIPETAFESAKADFTMPSVPADSCALLTGYIDRDRDFDLLYSVTVQPTSGDLAFSSRIVEIGSPDDTGWVSPGEGVAIRADTIVPLDKPAFDIIFRNAPPPDELPEGIFFDFVIGSVGTQFIEVYAKELESEIQDVESTLFTFIFAPDLDENGLPDDLSGTGFSDLLSPTVVFRKLDDSDPTGLTLDTENPIIIPAAALPFEPPFGGVPEWDLLGISIALGLPYDGVAQFTYDRMLVAVRELVLIDRATRTTQSIRDFEEETGRDVTGTYQMMVMNSTGQLWTIPNELVEFGHPDQGLRMRVLRGE
jgi:hypothetical protein